MNKEPGTYIRTCSSQHCSIKCKQVASWALDHNTRQKKCLQVCRQFIQISWAIYVCKSKLTCLSVSKELRECSYVHVVATYIRMYLWFSILVHIASFLEPGDKLRCLICVLFSPITGNQPNIYIHTIKHKKIMID